jgi:hypothetical protein
MNVGDIFVWDTNKAKGHDSRKKMHVFICVGDWSEDNTFLFISSIDYEGDFPISASDYEFLTHDSFVACHSQVTYSDEYLAKCSPALVGRLLPKDIGALHDTVAASEKMEGQHILRICAALRTTF